MTLPKRDKRHVAGERAQRLAELLFPEAWIPRPQQAAGDYGIDLEEEVADAHPSGVLVKVQIRSHTPIKWATNGTFVQPVEEKHFNYWRLLPVPVIVVLVDRSDPAMGYWAPSENRSGKGVRLRKVDCLPSGAEELTKHLARWYQRRHPEVLVLRSEPNALPVLHLRGPLLGHSDVVRCLAFSPDDNLLASGSHDHTAKLWDVQTGRPVLALRGHRSGVLAVAFGASPLLVTGSADCTVRLWDATSGKTLCSLTDHHAPVRSLAVSPDQRWLASGDGDGITILWDLSSSPPSIRRRFPKHDAAVVDLAFTSNDYLLCRTDNHTTYGWPIDRDTPDRFLPTPYSFEAIRHGDAFPWFHTAADSSKSYIRSPDIALTPRSLRDLDDAAVHVAVSPRRRLVAIASDRGSALVLDGATGRLRAYLGRHRAPLLVTAFNSTGTRIATGSSDRTIHVWSLDEDKRGDLRPRCGLELKGIENWVEAVVYSPRDNELYLGTVDRHLRAWRPPARAPRHVGACPGETTRLAISADGKLLALGSRQGTVSLREIGPDGLLDTISLPVTHPNMSIRALAVAKSGMVASGSADGLICVTAKGSTNELRRHTRDVTGLAFLSATQLVSVSWDCNMFLWTLPDSKPEKIHVPLIANLSSVAFASGLLVAGTSDGHVIVWTVEADSLSLLGVIRPCLQPINGLAFSTNAKVLAAGSGDGSVRAWTNVERASPVGKWPPPLELRGHEGPVLCVAVSPDGAQVVSGGRDGTARVCRLPGGDLEAVLGNPRNGWWLARPGHVPCGTEPGLHSMVYLDADGKLLSGSEILSSGRPVAPLVRPLEMTGD